jgi:hypothetical protein
MYTEPFLSFIHTVLTLRSGGIYIPRQGNAVGELSV